MFLHSSLFLASTLARQPAARLASSLLVLLPLLATINAHAQAVPDAGQSLREIERQPLVLPPRQRLDLSLPDEGRARAPTGGGRIAVREFRVSGNSVFESAALSALLSDLAGRELTLAELQDGARRITRLYREQGYPLARAWLPRQEIAEGVVRIEVLEGRYGQVRVDNHAGLRASALAPLSELKPGEVVQAAELERALLLTRDLAGVDVKSTLQPGTSVGATDLLVEAKPGSWFKGSVELDNYGNRYSGENRLGAAVELGNLAGFGDKLSLRLLGSDEGQLYGRVGWQGVVNRWGTQLGASYAQMHYELGKDFAVLDARGTARVASVWALHPLLRTRDASIYATLQFDDKQLKDDIHLYNSHKRKHAQVWSATLAGNSADDWLGGGLSSFTVGWSLGQLDLRDAGDLALDAATARTQGSFQKMNASLVRHQRLIGAFSLYGQLDGQWANGNLDSSDKMVLGGVYGVRAYPQGEAAGDQGLLLKLELRYAWAPGWQLAAFVDHGEVRENKEPWATGSNHQRLTGAGLGLNWADGQWRVQTSLAWRVGGEAATSGSERTPRLWMQVARGF